jgi:hypothetical protein
MKGKAAAEPPTRLEAAVGVAEKPSQRLVEG